MRLDIPVGAVHDLPDAVQVGFAIRRARPRVTRLRGWCLRRSPRRSGTPLRLCGDVEPDGKKDSDDRPASGDRLVHGLGSGGVLPLNGESLPQTTLTTNPRAGPGTTRWSAGRSRGEDVEVLAHDPLETDIQGARHDRVTDGHLLEVRQIPEQDQVVEVEIVSGVDAHACSV